MLDLFLPPVCVHCHAPLAEHGQLCGPCWSRIDFIAPPLCDVTGLPLPFEEEASDTGPPGQNHPRRISALALARPPVFDRARSVALYGDVMRHLVHSLKYGDRREGLALFGRWLELAGRDFLDDTDLIMPVPLYRTRLWQRRFNQSALLAFELSKRTGLPVNVHALRRHRATRTQVGLSERQRRRNVTGAFTLAPKHHPLVKNRNILLIDDVLTTGSTVDACSRVLKKAGADRVDVLVLARAGHSDGLQL